MPHSVLPRIAPFTLALLLAAASAAGEPLIGQKISGVATPLGPIPGETFSTLTFEMERCGPVFRTRWRDDSGRLLAEDELDDRGGSLSRYRYARPTVDERATVDRVGESLQVEHFENGAERTGNFAVKATPPTVVGPMIALVAERELARLRAGETIPVRYAIPDRMSVFELTLRGRASSGDAGTFEVLVTANNWVVRQFAKPVSLFFDDAGTFLGMRGRALPAIGTPGHRQPLEVDARVRARETGPCS